MLDAYLLGMFRFAISNANRRREWSMDTKREEEVERLLALANHVLVMADDAYLTGHPEWHEIVKEAHSALAQQNHNNARKQVPA